jgi:hypothetical protein
MKKSLKYLFAAGVLTVCAQIAAKAQIASYQVVVPEGYWTDNGFVFTNLSSLNDAHANPPNVVVPIQGAMDAEYAPASSLIMNPQPALPVDSNGNPDSPYGLSAGYPFGYTVSAETVLFPTTLAGAESQGTYLTFSIAPQGGASIDLTKIDFSSASFSSNFYGQNSQISGNPASGYTATLTSSLDNYATSLGDISFNATTSGSDITFSNPAFADITTPTTFHLDFYGTADGNEAKYVYLTLTDGSVINVDGSVNLPALTPEPGTYALLGLGLASLVLIVRNRRSLTI